MSSLFCSLALRSYFSRDSSVRLGLEILLGFYRLVAPSLIALLELVADFLTMTRLLLSYSSGSSLLEEELRLEVTSRPSFLFLMGSMDDYLFLLRLFSECRGEY